MIAKLFWNAAWLLGVIVTAYLLAEAFLPEALQAFPSGHYPKAGFMLRCIGLACCIGWYCWAREEKPPADL